MTSVRQPAFFLADSLGIDFLNSVAQPAGAPVEWLADGEGLLAWLVQAGLLEEETAARLRATSAPGELDQAAAQAREMREWFRGFVDEHRGAALGADALAALEPLNVVLAMDEASRPIARKVVRDQGGAFERVVKRRWSSPASLLPPIADAMADVVCDDDFRHVKQCEGPACTLMFLDRTKRHARRWCSMALCGNRAKQAAHRERLKQQGR